MQNNPSERVNIIGRRVPYHLQYLREGGVDIKPREEKEYGRDKQSHKISNAEV